MKLENTFTVPAPLMQAWPVLLDVERVAPCLPGAALEGGDGDEYRGAMTIKLGPVTSRFEGTVRIEEADEVMHRAVLRAQARDARGKRAAAAVITTRMRQVPDGTEVAVETDLQVSGPAAQFGRGVMQDVSGKLMRQFAECLAEEMAQEPFGVAVIEGDARRSRPIAANVAGAVDSSAPARDGAGAAPIVEYQETAVGRLPKGPAGDAALAATQAAAGGPTAQPRPARPRRSAEALDLGAASRAAVLKRVLPVAGVVLAAGAAAALRRGRSRRIVAGLSVPLPRQRRVSVELAVRLTRGR